MSALDAYSKSVLFHMFWKYVLTLQPINKGQSRANNYLPTSGLLFFAKAGKLSSKFSVSGFILVLLVVLS